MLSPQVAYSEAVGRITLLTYTAGKIGHTVLHNLFYSSKNKMLGSGTIFIPIYIV